MKTGEMWSVCPVFALQ